MHSTLGKRKLSFSDSKLDGAEAHKVRGLGIYGEAFKGKKLGLVPRAEKAMQELMMKPCLTCWRGGTGHANN